MAAKFEHSKQFNSDKKQLLENAKIALEKCKFKIVNVDESSGIIQAKAGFNIWSWSEKIDVKVEDNGKVTIKSECALFTQFIDWGKNKRNVKKFFTMLG